MGKTFDNIPEDIMTFIRRQEVFWVATSPLSADGHINVSPKGLRGSFFIEGPNRVWYEDLTGSGCETIAHVRENGRITILFSAFQGTPETVRLYGKGTVHEFGSAEYEARLPLEKRRPGSRSAIVIDVHRVATSCGWGVPIFEYKGQRRLLPNFAKQFEKRDEAFQVEQPEDSAGGSFAPKGIKWFWQVAGTSSIDGLPALQESFQSGVPIKNVMPDDAAWVDKDKAGAGEKSSTDEGAMMQTPVAIVNGVMCFMLGVIITYVSMRFSSSLSRLVLGDQASPVF